MNLTEHQGKKLFNKFRIKVPKGTVINRGDNFNIDIFNKFKVDELVLKAQIPFGKRGKSGGVLFTNRSNFKQKIKELFSKIIHGFKINQIRAEEKLNIAKELYLSITLSRAEKSYMLIFSSEGGVEIEEIAEKTPQKIIKVPLRTGWEAEFDKQCQQFNLPLGTIKKVIQISKKLHQLAKNDITLAEINPLILTKSNELVAADSKITLDTNALFRHKEYLQENKEQANLEEEAKKMGFTYVQLDGNIGVIGNGAGLVMCTLDTLAHFNGAPANFLDIGGGANREKITKAIEIVLKNPNCKSLFINIFGGITKCDEVASGISNYLQKNKMNIPVTVRLIGTNEQQGQQILKQAGIHFFKDIEQAINQAVVFSKGE